ncbi:hypothetical protein C7408_114135 [Paraburkholderia caballeronis]|uniref:Uncharacterized protein n=1 Tax=Paraburkholderia caballeronis TaxID=416943 RepID=A0A1H7PTG8_9BURK|nr:hypothetical protein C7403_107159 [Paraburkholderia caballeronis]PXX00124.1 hypothetical protein C7407_107159 [Paraburkholderia caballeronis]RAJ97253.1 hypothetical protein C7409_107159 [Paraburkholderia caballeronis]TDV09915.1 hypothetical protein C7408_114135 [Paraburkholderia caballeronis]TDV14159.1 hypothetical protein C7406_115134 [Paraburkholderia caballeronis]
MKARLLLVIAALALLGAAPAAYSCDGGTSYQGSGAGK